jgi:hypothetical protein
MQRSLPWLAVIGALAAIPAVACGGDDDDNGTGPGSGVTIADLAGTWDAEEVVFQSLDNPLIRFDLVALGGSLTLTVQADGDYSATAQAPGELPETESGTVAIEGDQIVLTVDGVPGSVAFDFTLVGNRLSMVTEEEGFDFDGDEVDDPARLTLVAVRRS